MRILLIHPHDVFSAQEPWTIRIKKFAEEFRKRGHTVTVAYFSLDHTQAGNEQDCDGVRFIAMDRRVGAHILLKNTFRMAGLVRRSDIVHFQKYNYYAALPALICAWFAGTPVHYDWDDWETKIFYYSNPTQRFIGEFIGFFERWIPKAVDTVSVASRHLRTQCESSGVIAGNMFPAPVGADLSMFGSATGDVQTVKERHGVTGDLVMYVGQLHGGQYVELFIKAAPQVLARRPQATFMIVGDGYRRKELEHLAVECGVHRQVLFTGFVAHEQVSQYMAAADVCVACFEENDITKCKSPLKIVEYMAARKAIVASNVGEVRNMLGGVGVLTEPGDPVSLAGGIVQLLEDVPLRKRLQVLAREKVERKYNWSVTAGNLLMAYDRALCLCGKRSRTA